MQYCSLQHQTVLSPPDTFTTSFLLWPSSFILTGTISSFPPLFPSGILDTFWPGEFIFQCLNIFFFLFILSVRFSKQEYWNGLPYPSPGDLPDPEIELMSPALAGDFYSTERPVKPHYHCAYHRNSFLD